MDPLVAEAPTDLAPKEQVETTGSPVDQDLKGPLREADVRDLLSRSELSVDELTDYLQATDPPKADNFASTGVWPERLQIPRDASVLNEHGKIDWSQVPQGGYLLDEAGNAIKEPYVPEIGQVIDRYGPPYGRYTSPVIDGTPYPYGKRSLPYVEDPGHYQQYVVTGDFSKMQQAIDELPDEELKADINADVLAYDIKFEAYRGPVAPGFGSGGGAVQVELPLSVEYLKALGMIAEK